MINITKMFDNEMLGRRINSLPKGVLDLSASSIPLLTSDRPVVGTNIWEPEGRISIPINPTKLWVAAANPAMIDRLRKRCPTVTVKWFNRLTVGRARKYVWAPDLSQTDFIEKNMSKTMKSTPFYPIPWPPPANPPWAKWAAANGY